MNILNTYISEIAKKNEAILKSISINFKEHAMLIEYIAKTFEPNFKFTDKNKVFYHLLLLYFAGNPEFDSFLKKVTGKDGSRGKGLLVVGNVGSGKTFSLTKVFKEYTSKVLRTNSFQNHDFYSIKRDYELIGAEALTKYGYIPQNKNGNSKNPTRVVLIDDFLSTKSTASHYGNKTDIADLLITLRYDAYKRGRKLTHFTMNLYPNELDEILDARTISRLQEMCNIIALEDCDWRKA